MTTSYGYIPTGYSTCGACGKEGAHMRRTNLNTLSMSEGDRWGAEVVCRYCKTWAPLYTTADRERWQATALAWEAKQEATR